MTPPSQVLFIQKRSTRAGAQTSLSRLTRSGTIRELHPAVLLGTEGWLAEDLREHQVPTVITPFPSPRSLATRLLGLKAFADKAARCLGSGGIHPRAIIANDHQECPLALALSARYGGIPVLAILRSPGMTEQDFKKYGCGACHALLAVGADLQQRVASWAGKPVAVFEEGFLDSEFQPPVALPAEFPTRILVIGSEEPRKGFTDFIEALDLIEREHPSFPGIQCDFTGKPPADAALLNRPRRSRFQFLGRVEGFSRLVREYAFVIHPSRAETFGMAPVEAILAGVPTFLSTTGIVPNLGIPATWQFPPSDARAIAAKLLDIRSAWPVLELDLPALQQQIRQFFHIDRSGSNLAGSLARLGVR